MPAAFLTPIRLFFWAKAYTKCTATTSLSVPVRGGRGVEGRGGEGRGGGGGEGRGGEGRGNASEEYPTQT